MRNGPTPRIALLLATTAMVAGCAQTGNGLPGRSSFGTLKTSVSHLEHENEQLRKEVAKLRTDNREIEDRLVQEEADNGDLRARLDDARHLLGQKGYDVGTESASSRAMNGPGDSSGGATTLPAGQSSRRRRKAPFTQIPGRIEVAPPADPADDDPLFNPPKPAPRDEFGPQGRRDDKDLWLPIAQGTSSPTARAKVR